MKIPPINLYTYRQSMAAALWLAFAQLKPTAPKAKQPIPPLSRGG